MQQTKKPLFALALALWGFSSCSQDASDVQGSATGGGETVTISLRAEISVDDPSLRAIDYKLGTNAKGQLVPMPQFEDKQIVEVHTILKSSRSGSAPVAKTLKWRYDAAKKKLVLAPTNTDITKDENNIVIPNFNTDGGTKLYISGLIGGTLSGTKVTFSGTRELQGATNAGDAVGSLEVPYAFPWTELTINTTDANNTRERNGSYKYAQVPSTVNLKFAPQGTLIAYKLGNKQKAGAYTFTPSGFTVNSNAFGDQGTFELNTALPTQSTATVLPAWTEGTPSALVYRFADGHAPGTLEHEAVASKTYYAWVMPHKTQPVEVKIGVIMKGKSSRPETAGFKDYTNTWITDYTSRDDSRVTLGRVHRLVANSTEVIRLPIEYVTDYNLAGGEGLTHTFSDYLTPGMSGSLRFADSHNNDASGYYNWYKVAGRHHATANPQTKNLQTEIDAIFGKDQYSIPSRFQWLGIFPSGTSISWESPRTTNHSDYMAVGSGDALLFQAYKSDFIGLDYPDSEEGWICAIRFQARTISSEPHILNLGGTYVAVPSASDNSMKCAFRYRRIEPSENWLEYKRTNTTRLIVDVVYLGEETVPTRLGDISSPRWWEAKQADGLVISKVFPASGYMNQNKNNVGRKEYGAAGIYWASDILSTTPNYETANGISFNPYYLYSYAKEEDIYVANSVRLFKR